MFFVAYFPENYFLRECHQCKNSSKVLLLTQTQQEKCSLKISSDSRLKLGGEKCREMKKNWLQLALFTFKDPGNPSRYFQTSTNVKHFSYTVHDLIDAAFP